MKVKYEFDMDKKVCGQCNLWVSYVSHYDKETFYCFPMGEKLITEDKDKFESQCPKWCPLKVVENDNK